MPESCPGGSTAHIIAHSDFQLKQTFGTTSLLSFVIVSIFAHPHPHMYTHRHTRTHTHTPHTNTTHTPILATLTTPHTHIPQHKTTHTRGDTHVNRSSSCSYLKRGKSTLTEKEAVNGLFSATSYFKPRHHSLPPHDNSPWTERNQDKRSKVASIDS